MKDPHSDRNRPPRIIRIFGRQFAMPRSRVLRISIGMLLVLFGLVGFLPVLGFWMIPLGLFVISHEFAMARRYRRRAVVWWERRTKGRRPRRCPGKDPGDPA